MEYDGVWGVWSMSQFVVGPPHPGAWHWCIIEYGMVGCLGWEVWLM